ncbi:MAG TPA: CsgG/HfaB family protein, partial [Spirochaetota bacterium]|nr:CsgG/HfaB family protein [Spirochaetota bacterium]
LLLDDLGAEVIIIGTAQTSDQSGALRGVSRNMKSKQANIRLRAIDVYTGRILASSAQNAPAVHIDAETASKDAIQRCLRKMLGRLDEDTNQFESGPFLNQITKKFLESATRRMITITVAGLNFADMTKFREQLQGRIRGVGKVYPRGQTGTAAKLEIEFAGKTHDFAQELNSKASSIGFGIEILEQKPNRLSIKAVRNQ